MILEFTITTLDIYLAWSLIGVWICYKENWYNYKELKYQAETEAQVKCILTIALAPFVLLYHIINKLFF